MPRDRNDFQRRHEAFEREWERGSRLFVLWFALCALLSVGVIGVVVWAVIQLVQWVTTK